MRLIILALMTVFLNKSAEYILDLTVPSNASVSIVEIDEQGRYDFKLNNCVRHLVG